MTGGVYHQALGEIVRSRIMLMRMREQMIKLDGKRFIVYTDRKNIGKVVGHGGQNKALLSEEGITFKIKEKTGVYLEIKTVL